MRVRQSGFSLVEMLAVLAVLSIAGLALVNAMTTSVRTASLTVDAALARMAAHNLMSLAVLEIDDMRASRSQDGDYTLAGRTFDWRFEVEPSGQPGLDRLRLVVLDARTGRELQRLETLRRVT